MDFLSFDTIAVGVIFLALVRELFARQRGQRAGRNSVKPDHFPAP